VAAPLSTVTAATCPGNNNTIFADPNTGYQYLIECGIDHQAGDLAMTYVKDLAGCIAACATTTGCVDVSLSGTACYMKKSVGTAQKNGGVNGAKLLTSTTSSGVPGATSAPSNTAASSPAATTAAASPSGSASANVTAGPPLAH